MLRQNYRITTFVIAYCNTHMRGLNRNNTVAITKTTSYCTNVYVQRVSIESVIQIVIENDKHSPLFFTNKI